MAWKGYSPFHADNFLQLELDIDTVQRPVNSLAELLAIKDAPIQCGFFRIH